MKLLTPEDLFQHGDLKANPDFCKIVTKRANARLDQCLKDAKTVYSSDKEDGRWDPYTIKTDTHKARLIQIEKLNPDEPFKEKTQLKNNLVQSEEIANSESDSQDEKIK